MNLLKKQKAFTLVELIIVITILAILATIAFVSFQGYVKDSRDSTRLTTLKNIESGLQTFQVKTGNYPDGENMINILGSGVTIMTQGFFGDNASKSIGMKTTPIDPYDQMKYIYALNPTKTKYQLVSFLEKNNQYSFISSSYAIDYSQRFPIMVGSSLGLILDINNNPINTPIDVLTYTGTSLKAIVDNSSKGIITGTGYVLGFLKDGASKNCNEILQKGYSKGDGVYIINTTGLYSFNVYCDMTNDGGGWTFVAATDSANNNHVNSSDVTSNLLISLNGYGKFSDEIINNIYTNSYRLENRYNRLYKHIWKDTKCKFSSISEISEENGCFTVVNGGGFANGRLGIGHKDGSLSNESYVYGYNQTYWPGNPGSYANGWGSAYLWVK